MSAAVLTVVAWCVFQHVVRHDKNVFATNGVARGLGIPQEIGNGRAFANIVKSVVLEQHPTPPKPVEELPAHIKAQLEAGGGHHHNHHGHGHTHG